MDDYDTDALLEKARQMYGLKIRCTHNETTLVQHVDPDYGWFACYQCDRCGQITRKPVTADDLDTANEAPWLDVALYEQVTQERLPGETVAKAFAFFGKAAR